MSGEVCQTWIDRAIEAFLGKSPVHQSCIDDLLQQVPPDCQKPVQLVLSRIRFANETEAEANQRPCWTDDYELVDFLGRGGMGNVYLASPRCRFGLPGSPLAIKIPHLIDAPLFASEVWNQVLVPPHPSLVNWRYLRFLGGSPCILMEYMDRGSLRKRFDPFFYSSLDDWFEDFFDVAIQVCWALKHLHSFRLIHQDIKPANVLFRSRAQSRGLPGVYRVGLADFGVSSFLAGETGVAPVVGFDVAYAAPEQVAEHGAVPASDVYSLGKTLSHFCRVLIVGEGDDRLERIDSLLSNLTIENPDERIGIGELQEGLQELYEELTGRAYFTQPAMPQCYDELSDYVLEVLGNPGSVFNQVTRLKPPSSLPGADRATDIEQLHTDLFDGHDTRQASRISLLVQIVFARALHDGVVISLDEVRSVAQAAEKVVVRYENVDWPAHYSVEFAKLAIPVLERIRQTELLDAVTRGEVDEILGNLLRMTGQ